MSRTDIQAIPLISVSYNSAELIEALLTSFRRYYSNPVTIIDGSSAEHYKAIEEVCARYPDVKFIHFEYNIHHGPGMAWAYQNLDLQGPVLVLDSDILVINPGLIEALASELKPGMYGVGYVNHVNEGGFDVVYEDGAVRYLHPACMLCDIEVVRQWPMPTKHGAPNIEPMLAIHRAEMHDLIRGISWVKHDFDRGSETKHYLRHDWQGTVMRTGGYHLEEWQRSLLPKQSEGPSVAEFTNASRDLLSLIPADAGSVIEVGCKSGRLAQAYKRINPDCNYTGVEADPVEAAHARALCDEVLQLDIETMNESFYALHSKCKVWIFDSTLTQMRNPWDVLTLVRQTIPADGCVVARLPNAQHWSILAKLSVGDFRYDSGGLLDCSHFRYFTRATMLELFARAGFKLERGYPRIVGELKNIRIIDAIRSMAIGVGADPDLALQDSAAFEYVIKAVPI